MKQIIAIDTETDGFTGPVWSVQYSTQPGEGRLVLVEDKKGISRLRAQLENSNTLTVVHNAIFDLSVLSRLDIRPCKTADSMVMAYLLGYNSIGLKNLAYRLCGLEMYSYKEVTADASEKKARAYIDRVLQQEWDDPEPILEIRPNGGQHVKFPQNIHTRLLRYVNKYESGTASMDLVEYWDHKDRELDRAMVEPTLGPLHSGYLSDIPFERALHYACMDADATGRIYPILWEQIQECELEEVFWRDMGVIPMALDMMATGIKINPQHFYNLGAEFEERIEDIGEGINTLAGRYVNPGSSKQVAALLNEQGIKCRNTSAEELDKHRDHEIVRLIQEHRGYRKFNSTYISVLPKYADGNDRIHTRLSLNRTATGRLASSDPNLQNQPIRSEDGRKIRQGFISERGELIT